MLGLVLQGGGARGAFQAGAVWALTDAGYRFDGVAGTSIGALNGAMLAQGDFERCIELWQNINVSRIADFDDMYAKKIAGREIDIDTVKYILKSLGKAAIGKGIKTDRIKTLIESYIDEEKLRNSSMDFGLVTYNLSQMKPYELFKEEIPQGKLAEYVMASANFPGLSKLTIDEKTFVDGGVYENLPINMLVKRGYKDIIAVTTKKTKFKTKDKSVNIKMINPSEKPGTFLNFTHENVQKQLKMGYLDGEREIKGYKGELVYVTGLDFAALENELLYFPSEFFLELTKILEIKSFESRTMNLVNCAEKLAAELGVKKYNSAGEIFFKLAEKVAIALKFDRLQVLTFSELVAKTEELLKNQTKKNKAYSCFEIFAGYYK